MLTLFGILIYGLYPLEWPLHDPIRQFFLVMASVSAGAAFLPELSSDLWHIRADEVRGLIPHKHVKQLERALIHAQVAEAEWADRIVDSALEPLLGVGHAPHRVVADVSYSAQVHPLTTVQLGARSIQVHLVEASIKARRVLPPSGPHGIYWVTVARDDNALKSEFREETCLFREVVQLDRDMSDEEWREHVGQLCHARIVLDGVAVEASQEAPAAAPSQANDRVVRWYFSDPELARLADDAVRSSVTISLDYAVHPSRNRFHVELAAYYVMGGAHLDFKFYDELDEYLLDYEVFIGQALDSNTDIKYVEKASLCKELSVVTADDSLIWPGSGLMVAWQRRPDAGPRPGGRTEGATTRLARSP